MLEKGVKKHEQDESDLEARLKDFFERSAALTSDIHSIGHKLEQLSYSHKLVSNGD